MRPTLPVLVLTAGALALSACASTSYASDTPRPPATAAAKHPAAAQPAKQAAAPGRKTAKAAVCDAFQLEATIVDTEAGAGSVTSELRITNLNGRDACRLPGRLRVTLDDGGRTVATAKAARGSDVTVVLGAKKSVTAILKTANGAADLPAGQACSRPGRVLVQLPGNPRHESLPERTEKTLRSCGGLTISTLTATR